MKYNINPAVWGTSGLEMGRIGVIAHETGHYLGLPDLYDTDSSPGNGIGNWGLMGNAWGFMNSQLYPPHLSAWPRVFLEYVTPTPITTSGDYTLSASATTPTIFIINKGFPNGEYLLIENRQPVGFDTQIGAGGLAIYHIDESKGDFDWSTEGYPGREGWPTNGNHYRVSVLQADGLYDLEKGANRGDFGDLWVLNSVLSPTTVPNTNAYQAGYISNTDISIRVISGSQANMTFRVDFEQPTCASAGVVCPANMVLLSSTTCNLGNNCDTKQCCALFCSIPSNVGAACDDGNVNTIQDLCTQNGVCAGVQATCGNTGMNSTCASGTYVLKDKVCVPGTSCNAGSCCATFCQVPSNLGAPCNDMNTATVNDICTSVGVCAGVAFCFVTSNAGMACNDSNINTVNDVCNNGVCQGVQATCSNANIVCGAGQTISANIACTPGSTCNSNTCCYNIPLEVLL